MSRERIEGIYAIIDAEAGGSRDPLALTGMVLKAGVKLVQLRAKQESAGRMLELARKMNDLCRKADAVFIVNDRLDVALAAGAHGVHLGQDDLPLEAARGLAGADMLIGISTHSVEEAVAAQEQGADYIGFGAMFATSSKEPVTAPQGPERLARVVRAVEIPVAAIGGIKREHLPEIKRAGATAAAVISAILGAPDPEKAAREMVQAFSAVLHERSG